MDLQQTKITSPENEKFTEDKLKEIDELAMIQKLSSNLPLRKFILGDEIVGSTRSLFRFMITSNAGFFQIIALYQLLLVTIPVRPLQLISLMCSLHFGSLIFTVLEFL
jgi:hypothetical protein